MQPIRLSEFTNEIKKTINLYFDSYYYVIAEINQFTVNEQSGHAYLTLIEKAPNSDRIIASIRAIIWASRLYMILTEFEEITGKNLQKGLQILAKVSVNFHEVYGLSLIIYDIEASYTLGEMERLRQQIIKQITDDGIINMNKNLPFPLVPQRIAVISSPNAAGFEDFKNQLNKNQYKYKYQYTLFPAIMQGEKTERSVINALEKIYENTDNFDLVVIIRGGGSKLDLSAFDSYEISVHIAQFPLPVLTGIGHHRDLSVADIVAWKALKTPTATADFLIHKTHEFEQKINKQTTLIHKLSSLLLSDYQNNIQKTKNKLTKFSTNYIPESKNKINNTYNKIKSIISNKIKSNEQNLLFLQKQIKNQTNSFINNNYFSLQNTKTELNHQAKKIINLTENNLSLIKTKLETYNPQHILNRGYTLIMKEKEIIKSATELKKNDIVTIILKDGKKNSQIL